MNCAKKPEISALVSVMKRPRVGFWCIETKINFFLWSKKLSLLFELIWPTTNIRCFQTILCSYPNHYYYDYHYSLKSPKKILKIWITCSYYRERFGDWFFSEFWTKKPILNLWPFRLFTSDGPGTRKTLGFGVWKYQVWRNWFLKANWNQVFLHFSPNFFGHIFDDETFKNYQICLINPFFGWFRVPYLSLIVTNIGKL